MRSSRRFFGFVVFAAAALAAVVSAASGDASASESLPTRLQLDWSKLSDALREGGVSLLGARELLRPHDPASAAGMAMSQRRWIGLSPDFSLVARDWGGAQLLAGELSVTDTVRLSRSIRMVVTRVRLAEGRISPFAQIGVGQWRIDTDLMPALPHDTELATQMGLGFDLRVARTWGLALECDQTLLYRDTREPQHVSGPQLWGGYIAMRGVF